MTRFTLPAPTPTALAIVHAMFWKHTCDRTTGLDAAAFRAKYG